VLHSAGLPFVAVDLGADAVKEGRSEGIPVEFGDATRRAVLESLGTERARAVVVAVTDPLATRRIVSLVRQASPHAHVLVRVRRVDEIPELENLGANEVLPSDFEISIEILVRLLTHLGVPRHVVRVQESLIRLDRYQALRGTGRTPELLAEARKIVMGGILETAQVMAGSAAAGRTLAELDLRRTTGAAVLTVVRDGKPEPLPGGGTRLMEGDLIVLYGPHEAVDRALQVLEPPA
jgi:CPA2 family monovalent cation:H+ antiporter-2